MSSICELKWIVPFKHKNVAKQDIPLETTMHVKFYDLLFAYNSFFHRPQVLHLSIQFIDFNLNVIFRTYIDNHDKISKGLL